MLSNEPIVRRLQALSDHYGEFAADENARVLRWLLQHDEVRMVETFLAREGEEEAAEHPDVFITLRGSFEAPSQFGYALQKELASGYTESSDGIREAGLAADWAPPDAKPMEPDIAFLLRTLSSLATHYDLQRHITLVLRPEEIGDVQGYQLWLHRFALEAQETIRVVIFDNVHRPEYTTLAEVDPSRIWTRVADLDMPSALEEMSATGPNDKDPGAKYRELFVKLTNAVGARNLDKAQALAQQALAVTAAQGWFHLAVPIHFALATAYTSKGRHQDAHASYLAGEQSAQQGEAEGADDVKEVCPQLRLKSRLGRASSLIAAGTWRLAAELYEQTAPLAIELEDHRTTLDCYRLASFCYEQAGNVDEAFRVGMLGLPVARGMDKETLKTSTFAYLGEGLMRLTQSGNRQGMAPGIENEIIEIAGTREWRPAPVEQESAAT